MGQFPCWKNMAAPTSCLFKHYSGGRRTLCNEFSVLRLPCSGRPKLVTWSSSMERKMPEQTPAIPNQSRHPGIEWGAILHISPVEPSNDYSLIDIWLNLHEEPWVRTAPLSSQPTESWQVITNGYYKASSLGWFVIGTAFWEKLSVIFKN